MCTLSDSLCDILVISRSGHKGRDWSTWSFYGDYNKAWGKRHNLLINYQGTYQMSIDFLANVYRLSTSETVVDLYCVYNEICIFYCLSRRICLSLFNSYAQFICPRFRKLSSDALLRIHWLLSSRHVRSGGNYNHPYLIITPVFAMLLRCVATTYFILISNGF